MSELPDRVRAQAPPPVVDRSIDRGWRSLSGRGGAALVPQARMAGPMPWVVAIMVALTALAAAGALALGNLAASASATLEGGVSIQVLEPDPQIRNAQVEAALPRLREVPNVLSVRRVPQAELDALVRPWLGDEAIEGADIPIPAMIDLRLRGEPDAAALAQIERAIAPAISDARVDAQASWLRPVFAAIESLRWLALALIVLLGIATASAVLLAARTAIGVNRETIEIVHLLGGTDSQIARIFQRSIALDAAGGGAVGLALALVALLLLGGRFAGLGDGLVGHATLVWVDWIALALVPIAGVALAAITARLSVMHALGRML